MKVRPTNNGAEIELRKSGKERRYSWDYDEHFEIYEFDRKTHKYRQLTDARGYDAEGSWSPDGKLIAFTSNRRAYEGELTETEKKQFELDPANHERHLYHGRRRQQRAATHVDAWLRRRPVLFPRRRTHLLAAILAERGGCRSLDDEYRRVRQTPDNAVGRDVVGAVLSSFGTIPDLHDEPTRIRQLRTLSDRRRRQVAARSRDLYEGFRWSARLHARRQTTRLDIESNRFRAVAIVPGQLEP